MATNESHPILTGVIEGFYGRPWTHEERLALFDSMAGLNTYLYAPKDDLKQRALWRELYSPSELEPFVDLIRACQQRDLGFIYALSPGLDIRYGDKSETDRLERRFAQLHAAGCRHFALLFDDIPAQAGIPFASAQCDIANTLFHWLRERSAGRLLFCPTHYCGRMAASAPARDYLTTLGHELLPGIDVFWTGPEIISREIPLDHLHDVQRLLGRNPILWDNLYANDYDGRRFFCGPYSGRPPELRQSLNGILLNPNREAPLNHVPLRSLAEFVRCQDAWHPRESWLRAMREWFPRFATIDQPIAFEDLTRLGDCYYLPHEEGPEAEALHDLARTLLATPAPWTDKAKLFLETADRLRQACQQMTALRDRPLFQALNRYTWELREELDLLIQYVEFKLQRSDLPFRPDSHLPGTYRGGMVSRLQRLLAQEPDGTVHP